MLVRISSITERLRASLFFVPMVFVLASIGIGIGGIAVDTRLIEDGNDLPFGLTSTVDSARAVLSTIAGATITFAGIAFSVSLLLIQQASSQYSPRVIHGLFRDPFNKRIMGIVVGTFTYCLVILRSVRGPLEQDGSPVIPNLSVGLGVALGLISILSIVAFISHSAHSMDVSKILQDVSDEAVRRIDALWRPMDSEDDDEAVAAAGDPESGADVLRIALDQSGWIQQLDADGLARAADEGGTVRVAVAVGRYAVPGTPLCTIAPPPADEELATTQARRAIIIGDARTSQQDVSYGVRQLADVALKALSPGINDPTTAQDAIFHLGGVLRELLVRRPPPARRSMAGERIIEFEQEFDHAEMIALAFDEIRLAASGLPTVCIYLLEVLCLLEEALRDHGLDHVTVGLRQQAALIRDGAADSGLLPHDRHRIETAYDDRFGSA